MLLCTQVNWHASAIYLQSLLSECFPFDWIRRVEKMAKRLNVIWSSRNRNEHRHFTYCYWVYHCIALRCGWLIHTPFQFIQHDNVVFFIWCRFVENRHKAFSKLSKNTNKALRYNVSCVCSFFYYFLFSAASIVFVLNAKNPFDWNQYKNWFIFYSRSGKNLLCTHTRHSYEQYVSAERCLRFHWAIKLFEMGNGMHTPMRIWIYYEADTYRWIKTSKDYDSDGVRVCCSPKWIGHPQTQSF